MQMNEKDRSSIVVKYCLMGFWISIHKGVKEEGIREASIVKR